MNQDNFKNDKSNPNKGDLIKAIIKLAPDVISAIDGRAIKPHQGLGFSNWAESVNHYEGDPIAKAQIAMVDLFSKARRFFEEGKEQASKKNCEQVDYFLARIAGKPGYKHSLIESAARIYEYTGKCIMKCAGGQPDYDEAIKYLNKGLSLLDTLQKEYPDYQIRQELRISILNAIHYAKLPR